MLTQPTRIIATLAVFAPLFSHAVFRHVQVLLLGAILTPGRRTVANALRAMGLAHEVQFQKYHRVLNRDVWSSRKAAKILLDLMVAYFSPTGALVLGIDETLERRQGEKIKAKGIYRDAARSSRSVFVKASGLRWISLMLLSPIPFAERVWALPFLTILAPSERYNYEQGKRHKSLAQWAQQMLLQVRRWLPDREIVLVADGGYSVLTLLDRCARLTCPITVVTRLRLDAALYAPAPPRYRGQNGRPRKKGRRLPTLQQMLEDQATVWTRIVVPRFYSQASREVEVVSATCLWYHSGMPAVPIRYVLIRDPKAKFAPQALLCTDLTCDPVQILSWFVLRWQLETTFQEVRTHLGVETQRQWNALAIVRTTPALLGLFSLVTLLAHQHWLDEDLPVRQAAWYVKERATFSDALAAVRRLIWTDRTFWTSGTGTDSQKLPDTLLARFADALCYAN